MQEILHRNNSYVKGFKYALQNSPSENFQVVINADKRPFAEHSRRFNAPNCNEVAIVMAGDQHVKRDIPLKTRDNKIKKINDTHRPLFKI